MKKEKVFLMAFALLTLLFLSGCQEKQTEEPVEMFEPHCVTMEDEVWCSVELNRENCLEAGNRWWDERKECLEKQ